MLYRTKKQNFETDDGNKATTLQLGLNQVAHLVTQINSHLKKMLIQIHTVDFDEGENVILLNNYNKITGNAVFFTLTRRFNHIKIMAQVKMT